MKTAIALLCVSLPLAGGGALLVQRAQAIPAPREPEHRAVQATIVELLSLPCGRRNAPRTCYRPVAAFTDTISGQTTQTATRGVYRPAPYRKGDAVTVYIDTAGASWLAFEWDARHAVLQREYRDARRFPLVMGWLIIACAAVGILLSAGLTFFVDRE